jgi:hypothetical protein
MIVSIAFEWRSIRMKRLQLFWMINPIRSVWQNVRARLRITALAINLLCEPGASSAPPGPVHPYDMTPECQVAWLSQPFIAQIMDGTVKAACAGGATSGECTATGTLVGIGAGFALGMLPGPFKIFSAIAGADLNLLAKCLCNYYHCK